MRTRNVTKASSFISAREQRVLNAAHEYAVILRARSRELRHMNQKRSDDDMLMRANNIDHDIDVIEGYADDDELENVTGVVQND